MLIAAIVLVLNEYTLSPILLAVAAMILVLRMPNR
jgi:hypothetical protein